MGTAEGAAKARKKALAKNPNHLKDMQSKGGKNTPKEKRAFFMNPELARKAGINSGISRQKKKLIK